MPTAACLPACLPAFTSLPRCRADALGFLELLMGARPDLVARGFLAPVLQHFGDLLSKGSRGRSIKAGSLASLHGVVTALERFLSRATAALGGGEGGKEAAGAAAAAEEEDVRRVAARRAVLAWRRCRWAPAGPSAAAAAAAEGSGGRGGGAGSACGAAGADEGATAAAALLGHLLDCWNEAGPSQLAEAPELVAAQSLTALARQVPARSLAWRSSPACAASPAAGAAPCCCRPTAAPLD